jgi:hypothetical protein
MATISVQLSRQPKSDVPIPIALSDPAEADLSVQSLTFTTLDWNLPQQVVATGKDDKVKDGDKAYKVLFGPANSADEEFNSIGPAEVALTSIDGVCGNGAVDGAEACEPTGMNDCELGQMDCMVCNNSCELVPGNVTGFCGDGAVQAAQEQCDGPTMPCPYGQMSCMTCRNCQNTPGQVTGYCGDGVVQAARSVIRSLRRWRVRRGRRATRRVFPTHARSPRRVARRSRRARATIMAARCSRAARCAAGAAATATRWASTLSLCRGCRLWRRSRRTMGTPAS